MASASYREPRPHARSAETRQEKTRGRRRISRKAPDLSHDAVRTGAGSDGRLHTGTTYAERLVVTPPKGRLWPFAQGSPPGTQGKLKCLSAFPLWYMPSPLRLPRARVRAGTALLPEWGDGKDEKGARNLKSRFQFFLRCCEV